MPFEFLMLQMIPNFLIRIPVRRILGQMKYVQPGLPGNVVHGLVGDVGRSLIHDHNQMPAAMMLQHLAVIGSA